MAQNIELKLKVENFSSILLLIKENNITFQKMIPQRDIYYKCSSGLLKLRIFDGKGELIYYVRNENTSDRISYYEILNVNPVEAEKFFSYLFEIETEVVKKRNLYIHKNTRIHLDEVEKLGNFIELETVVNEGVEAGKKEFAEVVKLLELDPSDQIKSSYRNLLLNK